MEKTIDTEINKIVDQFNLLPHPEGGYFKEVYRSKGDISERELTPEFTGARNFATSIYFLLTSSNFSGFHRIKQDEIWHFYHGSPLTVHVIDLKGNYVAHKVGFDLSGKIVPQLVVPAGCWFASSVEAKNGYAFVGCTVSPGFDFDDFELAKCEQLIQEFPNHEAVIRKLTRQ